MDDIPIPAVSPLFRHMQLEHNWRLEGLLDNRAAAFTLLATPEAEDWPGQRFNAGYPDYGYIDLPTRLKLKARFPRRGSALVWPSGVGQSEGRTEEC